MRHTKEWTVRIERQPHRDAVRRLREAYRKLWEMNGWSSATASSSEEVNKTGLAIQEISK
jgi:hypothetical protein